MITDEAMSNIKLAHIHAQGSQHDEAYLIANKDALLEIVYAICKAERTMEAATARLMTSDGEEFDLIVVCEDAPWADPAWQRAKLPYTEESAGVPVVPTIAPWDHPKVKRLSESKKGD